MNRNLDNGGGSLAGIANTYTFNVTGTASGGATTLDQLVLLNFPTDITQSSATLTPGVVQVGSTGYTNAQIAQHFLTHPAPLVNWNIPSSTNSAVLSSMIYYSVRRTPAGKLQQDETPVANLLTSMQYQSDRIQFVASGTIMFDGETFGRWIWSQQNPAVTLTIALSFGEEVDLRAFAKRAAPAVIAGG